MRRAVAGGAGGEVFLAKLCSRFAAEGLTLKNSYAAGFFFGCPRFYTLNYFRLDESAAGGRIPLAREGQQRTPRMRRRPSRVFEPPPAQPVVSALTRRLSALFGSTAHDHAEDAPFCRRVCSCCERPLGSGGVFMAFDMSCAPPLLHSQPCHALARA